MYLIEYADDQSKPMVLYVIQLQQIHKMAHGEEQATKGRLY